VVGLQPHAQRRAQRPAGHADLDPAGTAVPVVLDRPAGQAPAGAASAVLPGGRPAGELPALRRGHACSERDVRDRPERHQAPAVLLLAVPPARRRGPGGTAWSACTAQAVAVTAWRRVVRTR